MVLQKITYFQILGKPLIMYTGILALLLLVFTASIAVLNKKGIRTIPFQWHQRMAVIAIIFAFIHGVMGLLNYF